MFVLGKKIIELQLGQLSASIWIKDFGHGVQYFTAVKMEGDRLTGRMVSADYELCRDFIADHIAQPQSAEYDGPLVEVNIVDDESEAA